MTTALNQVDRQNKKMQNCLIIQKLFVYLYCNTIAIDIETIK